MKINVSTSNRAVLSGATLNGTRKNALRYLLVLVVVFVGALGTTQNAEAQTMLSDLEERDGKYYARDSDRSFTGEAASSDGQVGAIEEGYLEGEWIRHFDSGEPEMITTFETGQRVKIEMFFKSGRMRSLMNFNNGQAHGPRKAWTETGLLISDVSYANGRLDGSYRLMDETGNPLYTTDYTAGVLDGASTWWYPNGQKRWERHFEQGARSGTWIQYDSEGTVMMQSDWEDGELTKRIDPHSGH